MLFGQVHHVEYYVADLHRSNAFWNWFLPRLGYRKKNEWPEGVSWAHPNGTYLVFVQVEAPWLQIKNNRQGNGLNHIAFNGASKEHLDQLEEELRLREIVVLKRLPYYLLWEDPNGFAVEMFTDIVGA